MSSETPVPELPQESSPSEPPATARGADASLLTCGILGLAVFIVMIIGLLWGGARQRMAASTAAASISSRRTPTQVILLPLVSGKSTPTSKPTEERQIPPTAQELLNTPGITLTSTQASATPVVPGGTPVATNSPEPGITALPPPEQTQTTTPTTGPSPTPSATQIGPSQGLTIRNDRMCLDSFTNNLYIFGEIVNDSAQAYDILEWTLHVYDSLGEVPLGTTFFDLPTYSYIYANSAIPFAISAQVSTSTVTDYDLHLDYAPGTHIARNDLRIDDFTAVPDNRFIRVSGTWSHANAASIPSFVSIIGTIHDSQGRLINMHYLPMSYITVDPRLPAGQHRFSWLYLETNPCGEGTLRVSIVGE